MTTARATWLLAVNHGRMLMHRSRDGMTENRLLTLTLAGFLGVYMMAAYILVPRGVDFVHRLPLLGPLLTERLIYLLFFFFFVMLVISNATITGMGLFRRQDVGWQVALPLPYRSLVLWKTLEGMLLASWGLLILSAPILAALGRMFDAGPGFYLAGVPSLLCLVTIAANLSTWLLLIMVRWARRWWWKPIVVLAVSALGWSLWQFWRTNVTLGAQPADIATNVNQILKHTELATHPLLPSSWVSETVIAAGRHSNQRAGFFFLALLSYALFSIVITGRVASGLFYSAWNRVMSAGGYSRKRSLAAARQFVPISGPPASLGWLGIDRSAYALLVKDTRTFLREPTQWGQSALIFGLLLIYTSNLRRLGYDLENPFWSTVISYLNLLVCSLALSTLTTRFIYPQFSLEGRRFWILGLSPVPLHRVLSLKLRLSATVIAALTTLLVIISSFSLSLPEHRILFFVFAIVLLSGGLTSMALSLGTLLPNFREPNPAKIVSGFGGTLCLICSFLYILLGMTALLLPAWQELRPSGAVALRSEQIWMREGFSIGILAALTFTFGGIPYWIAKKRTKSLEYLAKL